MSDQTIDEALAPLAKFSSPAFDKAEFSPLSRTTLHEQIYDQIKDRLITGQFAPGQKMMLRGLAQALGTSIMPVRDALQRLESIGVLVMLPNRTMMVPEINPELVTEIMDIRVAMEGLAAERAAQRATRADVGLIEQHLSALRASAEAGDSSGFLQANWAFHRSIAQAARNQLLLSMIDPLWLRIGPLVRLSKPDRARMIKAVPFHQAIFDAILHGNGPLARSALVADVTGCYDMYMPDAQAGARSQVQPAGDDEESAGCKPR